MPVNSDPDFVIRDPLYGFVQLTSKEKELLKTFVLQRLTRIKQLGHTYIVYPSAVYTRFEHSIGATYVADRISKRLDLSNEEIKAIRIAGLVHDIGHGPFSHLFEQILKENVNKHLSHEQITKVILENDKEINACLGKELVKETSDILFIKDNIKHEVISGPLDADRIDYLRRDAYHTGVTYGIFDFERVIHSICKIADSVGTRNYVGIHEKGKDAAESYRLARYLMHTQVYEHHTRLIAEGMFLKAIRLAFKESLFSPDSLDPTKGDETQEFLDNYLALDDYSIQYRLLHESKGNAGKIISDLLNRKLLKRSYLISISPEEVADYTKRISLFNLDVKQLIELENKIASQANVDPDSIIVHLQHIKIKLYEDVDENGKEKPLLIRRYNGVVKHIQDESPFSCAQLPKRLFVFCKKDEVEKIGKVAEDIIGVKNQYPSFQNMT